MCSSMTLEVLVARDITPPAAMAMMGRPRIIGGRPAWTLDSLASLEISVRRSVGSLLGDMGEVMVGEMVGG